MNSLFSRVETLTRRRAVRIEQVKRRDDQEGFAVLPKPVDCRAHVRLAHQAAAAFQGP